MTTSLGGATMARDMEGGEGWVATDARAASDAPVATVARGDPVALLFEQYHAAIFAYLYRLVDDRDWAHDLTQESFLHVVDARGQLPAVANPRAWVYRIATNTALNALKRRRRFTWLPWRAAAGSAETRAADRLASRDAVERALAALDPSLRAPLLLFSHDGLSTREIATALGLTEGAVRTRLCRAREQFRAAYAKEQAA
jgi:RNA polymerase sigma-70 factor (ECF subfamily)